MSATVDVPDQLRSETVEARILKRMVWDRMWLKNEHFMAVIVGREGSGKSHTGIKIAECVDPSFTAERVMFDPVTFLKKLRQWKKNNETKGKMVVIDEAGVGVGVRTWYEKDQIRLNQVLQIIRDENMGVIFTLPRLEELDSQTEGRLHAFMEMTAKKTDEWAKVKWLIWDPTRDGRNKNYREYPEIRDNGFKRTVKRLCLSPPSSPIVTEYERRKNDFQTREYDRAIDEMEEDVDDSKSVKEITMDIEDGRLSEFVSRHGQTGQPFVSKDLIRAEFSLSINDAKGVKSLLDRKYDTEALEEYA